MKLSGKSLEQFEKWYLTYFTDEDLWEHNKKLTDSEKYGVLVDFFDSLDIIISIEPDWNCSKADVQTQKEVDATLEFDMMVFGDEDGVRDYETFKTRPQARAKAIEKAIEILNSRV